MAGSSRRATSSGGKATGDLPSRSASRRQSGLQLVQAISDDGEIGAVTIYSSSTEDLIPFVSSILSDHPNW